MKYKKEGVCDTQCKILLDLQVRYKCDLENARIMLKKVLKAQGGCNDKSGICQFNWNSQRSGSGIQITNNGKSVFLKESEFKFRTILGDKPFYKGLHYWKIHADKRTKCELKIGVLTEKANLINLNTSFSAYEFGFAFYGIGQTRNGSDIQGQEYGKRFKNAGVLGVLLDMSKGTLSFALNGEFFGIAFQNAKLK